MRLRNCPAKVRSPPSPTALERTARPVVGPRENSVCARSARATSMARGTGNAITISASLLETSRSALRSFKSRRETTPPGWRCSIG